MLVKALLLNIYKSVIPDFPGRNGVILVGGQRGQDRKELLSFLIYIFFSRLLQKRVFQTSDSETPLNWDDKVNFTARETNFDKIVACLFIKIYL